MLPFWSFYGLLGDAGERAWEPCENARGTKYNPILILETNSIRNCTEDDIKMCGRRKIDRKKKNRLRARDTDRSRRSGEGEKQEKAFLPSGNNRRKRSKKYGKSFCEASNLLLFNTPQNFY